MVLRSQAPPAEDPPAEDPPSAERVALARKAEAALPRVRDTAQPHGRNAWVMPAFVGVALLIPTVVGVSLYLLR